MEPLFPALPEDLKALSEEDLAKLLADHLSAAELIDADDAEFLGELKAEEILLQYEQGASQIEALRAETTAREQAHESYVAKKQEIAAKITEAPEEEQVEAVAEVVAEAEAETVEEEPEEVEEPAVERELVTAAAEAPKVEAAAPVRVSRTPPQPAKERIVVSTVEEKGAALVASGSYKADYPEALKPQSLATLVRDVASELGPLAHNDPPGRYSQDQPPVRTHVYADGRREEVGAGRKLVWDGPKTKLARADFDYPSDRQLTGGDDDIEKIRAVLPETVTLFGEPGGVGGEALVASGGLCAPATPFYTMPNFGTEAEPVWDSLPVFQAARGAVNVPDATYIADITTAISSISEANDALGGTFATKSCQDLDCPTYTETAVNIFAHCREYGNLNARAWPEKIAHENALTMQALSRTTEDFMLEQIKALSVNVTNGVETLGALIYLVDAIVKGAFGIRGRLRMPRDARLRALLPSYALDLLVLDTIQTQFDRFRTRDDIDRYLRAVGIDPVYYIDGNFAAGDDQIPDASQAAGALDGLPNTVQWALYPEGAFLGIDMGTLELGIVRDSTLNSTNDFQVFGERFRNLVRLAPAQACYWVTTDWCPIGQFPPAGTARTCE